MQGARNLTRRILQILLPLAALHPGVRLLLVVGYCGLALLLLIDLALHAARVEPSVEFVLNNESVSISPLTMLSSTVALGVGGALLLAGATDCIPLLLVIVASFMFSILLKFTTLHWSEKAVFGVPALAVFIGLVLIQATTRGTGIWRSYPVRQWILWLAVFTALPATAWVVQSRSATAGELYLAMAWIQTASIPVWVFLGASAVKLWWDVGYAVFEFSARLIRHVRFVATLLWALDASYAIFAVLAAGDSFGWFALLVDLPVYGVALAGPIAIVSHGHRWQRALVVLACTAVGLSLSVHLAFGSGQGAIDAALILVGLPSGFVFIAIATHGTMALMSGLGGLDSVRLSARARRDFRAWILRNARVLMAMGYAVVFCASILYVSNVRLQTGRNIDAIEEGARLFFFPGAVIAMLFLGRVIRNRLSEDMPD